MLRIADVKAKGLPKADGSYAVLPEEFCATLPEKCSCGADLEIAETLCKISCPNPKCITKVTQRAVDMLNYIGVLGMGEAKCRAFFEAAKLYNPYALFAWTLNADYEKTFKDVFKREFMEDIYEQLKTRREYTLSEYVKIGFLPDIQDSANVLFKDYTDLRSFYTDLDAKGTALIAELMGLPEDGAKVMNVYNSLLTFREDLMAGLPYVKIVEPERLLNVCRSVGEGEPYKNKAEFKAAVKQEFGEKVHINWLNSVSKNGCDYLVCPDANATSTKITQAKKYDIPAMTGTEFMALLRTMV